MNISEAIKEKETILQRITELDIIISGGITPEQRF
jgi:hypothetical protein